VQEVGKLNGEPEKGGKASEVKDKETPAKEAEPAAAPGKKEEKSDEESAKPVAAPSSDKNVTSVEPTPKPSPAATSEKEVPKAAKSQTPKAAEAPAEPPAAAARPAEAEPGKEPAKAAEPAPAPAPPKPPREKKPRPVLKDGERLTYDIEFIFKFKGLCNETSYIENVKMQVQNAISVGRGGGGGNAGMPPGGGYGSRGAPMMMPGGGGRGGGPMPGPGGRDRRDRGGPPMRGGGRGQLPMGYPMGNVTPLQRSENAFHIAKNQAQTHYEELMKSARSILNKLTMTNFEKLSVDLADLRIEDSEDLRGIVGIIFDKALEEGHFCKMYAELCNKIKDRIPEFQDETDPALGETKVKKVTFKRCLLNKCQEEFERADRYDEARDEETAHLDTAAKTAKTRRVRLRMLGNIKFIGELFAQRILNEKIMHDCVKKLLESKDEDTVECLCKLMATVGKLLDREEAKHYMDYYFDQMKATANEIGSNPTLFPSGKRLKFMIFDTIDLRKSRYPSPLSICIYLSVSISASIVDSVSRGVNKHPSITIASPVHLRPRNCDCLMYAGCPGVWAHRLPAAIAQRRER